MYYKLTPINNIVDISLPADSLPKIRSERTRFKSIAHLGLHVLVMYAVPSHTIDIETGMGAAPVDRGAVSEPC